MVERETLEEKFKKVNAKVFEDFEATIHTIFPNSFWIRDIKRKGELTPTEKAVLEKTIGLLTQGGKRERAIIRETGYADLIAVENRNKRGFDATHLVLGGPYLSLQDPESGRVLRAAISTAHRLGGKGDELRVILSVPVDSSTLEKMIANKSEMQSASEAISEHLQRKGLSAVSSVEVVPTRDHPLVERELEHKPHIVASIPVKSIEEATEIIKKVLKKGL